MVARKKVWSDKALHALGEPWIVRKISIRRLVERAIAVARFNSRLRMTFYIF
jgi:hypothetical protein